MLPELGQLLLILALLTALVQAVVPLAGAQRGNARWMAVARPAAYAQLLLVAGAFALLTCAFVTGDFSVAYVADNSNALLPLVYRYSAVWGAHEGSLLLWTLILALWTSAVALSSRRLPTSVVARVIGTLALVSTGFLAFLLFTSNPFARLLPAPLEGHDLNPLLQDPGLVIHPPLLYTGYVGFAVPFAFAVAALLDGQVDARWLRWTRPWTNVAWGFLTIGIALGSWWAYDELGWGGWWFWDPVENASFMPWLTGAALLHSQAITEKRGSFAAWTLLLAIATFSLSLLGTFLVRSGVLTSVHSFAADPARGLFILVFLSLLCGGALLLYALRGGHLGTATDTARQAFAAASRETLLLINNLLLTCACAMVLLGTLYPLLADALGLGKLSVGPPYFGTLFVVLMAPLVALLPFGPLTRWQREQASRPLALLAPWAGLALLAGTLGFFLAPQGPWKTGIGIAAAAWVLLGTARFVWSRIQLKGSRFTAEMLGMTLAHGGIAVFLIGALLVEALEQQREVALAPGQHLEMGRYRFELQDLDQHRGPNYVAERAHVQVLHDDRPLTQLFPEKRLYASGGQAMTEAGIHAGLYGDIYVSLGEPLGGNAWAIRLQIKPFVRWIWLGAALMALGGFVSAADRRLRRSPETP
ncbi:heme lyase CcmF/NrfE family subunit [Xanthomonas albilineans]|uniref:heme lyase CcmF/NrfE family subunit n=1 Tax=Xanthomonas albilineans TaxID=29447 RepID=UPI0005F35D66|nr:heme lyase CcmF/NrfE family subunit [Xanthomonas albilineans]